MDKLLINKFPAEYLRGKHVFVRIDVDGLLVLIDRVVVLAVVGEFFAAVNQDVDSDVR